MRYRLYKNSDNDFTNIVQTVLQNRGVDDCKKYLNLDSSVENPCGWLDNIAPAVNVLDEIMKAKEQISILVDTDPDGYCSAAMMYLWIKSQDKDYPVKYVLHKKAKAHGLSDDVEIPKDTKLLIIPDAGTNDTEQCKILCENGVRVLILDHHESERENPHAIIVNNQMSENYPNKNLCGAGVVYKFLQALDDFYWTENAYDYIDLVALANISDVMDLREYETRYLVNEGLANVKNKCFQAFIKAQDYSMKGKVNIHNVQWYITPVLNSMMRVGSYEEQELLFRAFIETDETFEYNKRATKDKPAETIQETIYDRAARLCKNCKSRQDKLKDKGTEAIIDLVNDTCDKEDKVIIADVSSILDGGLTGVVAIKIAEYFNKPCLLLRKHLNDDGEVVLSGSARNFNNSPIENFKDVVNQTNLLSGIGHANAFGALNLAENMKDEAIERFNEILENVEYDTTYNVDYILDSSEVSVHIVKELSQFDDIICQGIEEPIVAIENITLDKSDIEIFGKNEDTISFVIDDVKYIMFRCKEGNPLYDFVQNAWGNEASITFNMVGKPSINEYNGTLTPQIMIIDTECYKNFGGDNENYDEDNEDWW